MIVAADTTAARSIVKMKEDLDKIKELNSHLLMAYSGEPGQSNMYTIPVRAINRFSYSRLCVFQAIRSSLQSMSNATSACTRFVISILSARLLPLRGSVVRLQSLSDPETHIRSTCSSVDMTSQNTSPRSTG